VRLRNRVLSWTIAATILPAPALAQVAPRLDILSTAEQPVVLRAVEIRTEINGGLALTSVQLTFFNPNRRQLEGELQFPLLDGQSVVGMAMDIDGTLREAVPIDKARGQQVFEDVTRGNIDPALLSATQGSNYKLRVFPILPQRDKVVVLRYAEMLGSHGSKRLYRLPLYYGDHVSDLSVVVRVVGAVSMPHAASHAVKAPAFAKAGDAYVMPLSRRDFTGTGVLEVDVPAPAHPDAYTQVYEGRTYFLAELPVTVRKAPRVLPRAVTLAWDSSGSGAARDHTREFALLDAYFGRARDMEVALVRIRDVAEPAETFRITGGRWQALRHALEAMVYDGGTNLGAVAAEGGTQEVLLFSDGLSNFGGVRKAAITVPLFAISAAARADGSALRHEAERGGGRFIDLIAGTAADAADALLSESSRIVDVTADNATNLVAASAFAAQGRVTIAGMLAGTTANARVTIAHPGGAREVIAVPIDARRNASGLAASMWARCRVHDLEGDYDANRTEIRRIGRSFGLVTRETSLIVLDRVEDYARYDITPPAELMAAYRQIRTNVAQREAAARKKHIEEVVKLFTEKQAWWDRAFPKDTKPAQIAKDVQHERRAAAALGSAEGLVARQLLAERALRNDAAAAPMPVPPPSAAAPVQRVAQARAFAGAPRTKASPGTAAAAADAVSADAAATTIQLRRWTPDAPYIARLRAAAPDDVYPIYVRERRGYVDSTAFFLDAADVLFDRGRPDLAIRVLSNLAEMDLENRDVLRILGLRLMQAERAKLALPVLSKVLDLAPDEPQSYRDLGLAYAADGERQQAVDMLREVVHRAWDGRFPQIELVALAELNAIVATSPTPLDVSRIDPRLLRNLPLALRVVLTWDADNTDIDLWVTDPNGERAFYGNRLTYQGGRMSPDFTRGYGPEEFSLRQAKPGKYKVEANYYANRQQIVAGATTLQLRLTTGFGTARQKDQNVTLRLEDRQEVVFVGEFDVAAD
jgi:tetratricopeptide (TPR) repeat protein